MKNKTSWLKGYSVFFLMVIFTILLSQLFVPGITINSIPEKYLWRKNLIKINNNFRYIIGDRVFEIAVMGKDGWFYYTGDMSIQDYQKTSPMNVGNVKHLIRDLSRIKEKADEYGGTFLLVIPPNKSTIYPQYMPDEITVIGQTSSLDRLVERINKFSDIQVVDLRPALERASEKSRVYYKTDTHWNCVGAFYAYEEILSRLAVSHPQLTAYSLNDFEMISSQNFLSDISSLLGLSVNEDAMNVIPKFDVEIETTPALNKDYPETSLQVVVNSKEDLPNLMIFHDSFYNACLNEFIQPTFSRTISTPYKDAEMVDYLGMIEIEQPDVVIVEFVERYMDYFFSRVNK